MGNDFFTIAVCNLA